MFGNNNGNGNGVNVNTAFYTSYSDTSLLSVGGWNRNLSLKIQPAVGKDANGLTQYASDKTSTITTSIREENALALLEGFTKYIKPAIENSQEAKVTIAMGTGDKKKALSIIYDGKDAYLELAVGLSENGTTSTENIIKHKFNKKSYMVGYNPQTGDGEEIQIEADLFNFMKKIEKAQDLVPTIAHSINYSNANKAVFKNSNNNQNDSDNYSAPTNNFSGDFDEFLPIM
jgi:hypothetical protein